MGGAAMSEKKHLRCGASSAARWMSCPGSIRLEAQVADSAPNPAQAEGTLAHRVFEALLRTGAPTVAELILAVEEAGGYNACNADLIPVADLKQIPDEMVEGAEWAADEVYKWEESESDRMPDAIQTGVEDSGICQLRSEWMGDFSSFGMPLCGGTLDAVLVCGGEMHVFDFKYGWKAVAPEANPQLMLYGLQALLMLPDGGWKDLQSVTLHVLQPKVIRKDLYWRTTPAILMDWGMTSLRFAYERTFAEDAPCIPSDTACQWCKAAGICKMSNERGVKRLEDLRAYTPDTVPLTQIAALLDREAEVNAFFKALWARAYEAVKAGKDVPGLKVVQTVTRFKFEADAVAALARVVPEDALYEKKPRSPNQLSQVNGGVYKALANQYKTRPEKFKIALESDKRPAVMPDKMSMFEALSLEAQGE